MRQTSIVGMIVLAVLSVPLTASVSERVVQKFMMAKKTVLAAMQTDFCFTAAERLRLEELLNDAQHAISAEIASDDKKMAVERNKEPGGVTSPEMARIQRDIDSLLKMNGEDTDLFNKVKNWPACGPLIDQPPPPPPPPRPDPPPNTPPPKPVNVTPTHRTTTCPKPACRAIADNLNRASDRLLKGQFLPPQQQQAIYDEIQNLSKELDRCERSCATLQEHASIWKNPVVIGGIAGGGALAAVAVTRGGSSESTPSTGAASSFLPFAGTLSGIMQLVTDANTCAGSDGDYNETAAVSIAQNRAGTIQLNAAFPRLYHAALDANNGFADSETFQFLGSAVPGKATGTFVFASQSSATLTLQETTTYGSCSNTYRGQLR